MERGHTYEPIAREYYEKATFLEVSDGGFYEMGVIGDSNDGNVGKDGCIEIKTRIPNTFWERIEKKGIDNTYQWQVQGHLLIGDKKWCDFVDFCPEFPEHKKLLVHRVERDPVIISQLEKRLAQFEILVQTYETLLKK
jgi:hypothetical protein